jgi:replicative DNA helicase
MMPRDVARIATAEHAEPCLLGCVLIDPPQFDRIRSLVTGADFADARLGHLFEALQTLHDARKPIADTGWLLGELARLGVSEDVRSTLAISKLIRGVVNSAHVGYFAEQVRRAARLRQMQMLVAEWATQLHKDDAEPDAMLRWIDARLAMIDSGATAADCKTIGEFAADAIADAVNPGLRPTAMTGLQTVDANTGGFQAGETVTLAGRTGQGKTGLAIQIAIHNAERRRNVLFVSLEMEGRELARREVAAWSGVQSKLLRAGNVGDENHRALEEARRQLAELPLRIWAPPSATLADIRAHCRHEHALRGLSLLVIDYIGLVKTPELAKRQRHEQVAAVSGGLKSLAKELQIPILSLAQLNREADGEEPRLSHLRESGAIEQDSDVVMFLHHPATEKPSRTGQAAVPSDTREAFLIIAKHRHGQTGRIRLNWLPNETRFDCPNSF